MDFGILQILSHMRTKHPRLLSRPPKPPRKICQRQPIQPTSDIRASPSPQLLELPIPRPRIRWPLLLHLDNIDKPSSSEIILILCCGEYRTTEVLTGFEAGSAPFGEIAFWVEGSVVGARGKGHVLEFEVAARFEVVEGDFYDLGEVGEAAEHHAGKDEVEFLGPGPFFFEIIYFEAHIWWDAATRC